MNKKPPERQKAYGVLSQDGMNREVIGSKTPRCENRKHTYAPRGTRATFPKFKRINPDLSKVANSLGYSCSVCDRFWCHDDFKLPQYVSACAGSSASKCRLEPISRARNVLTLRCGTERCHRPRRQIDTRIRRNRRYYQR